MEDISVTDERDPNKLVERITVLFTDLGAASDDMDQLEEWLTNLVTLTSEGQEACVLTGSHSYSGGAYSACWKCGEPEE